MMGGSTYTPPPAYEPPPVPDNAPAFVPPDVARWAAPPPPLPPAPEPVAAPAFVPPSTEPPRPAPTTPSV